MRSINNLLLAIVRGTRQVLHHNSRFRRMLSSQQHSSRDSSKLGAVSRFLSLPSRAAGALSSCSLVLCLENDAVLYTLDSAADTTCLAVAVL